MNEICVLYLIVAVIIVLDVMRLSVHQKLIHVVEGCGRRHERIGLLERGVKTWSGIIDNALESIRR